LINDRNKCPQGWSRTTLGDCLRLINGIAYLRHELLDKGAPIIRIQNLNGGNNWFYSDLDLPNDKYCDKGDLLFAWSATFGPFIWNGSRSIYHYHIWKVEPSDALDQKFAYYLLAEITDLVKAAAHGVAMPHMTKQGMESWPVQLPPLNEQRRIAAKIEALKARSQGVKEELKAIAPLLDQFRQSVLAAAFRGDLTADWREKNPHVEPAIGVVENLREKRFSQAKTPAQLKKLNEIYSYQEEEDSNLLPESWRYIALEKLCDSFQYGTSTKSLASGKVPVLRMGNIQNGEIDWSDIVYTSDEEEIEKYKLNPGDVLFNRTNSPELVGKAGIYRGEHPAIFAGYLIKINNAKELDSEYLNYCLITGYAKAYCWKVKTDGVSQSNINAQKLAKFEVPFCSLEEQREVVHRINSLFLVANRLEQNHKEAKAYTDTLNQSILAKAFRGELVPQDPNDEPASVLLERIKAEREKLDTKKKVKDKTEKKSRKAKPEPEPKQLSFPGFE